MNARAEKWMHVRSEGLYCAPANCYIDPHAAVERAIITHGHADHARSGHGSVFATPETLAIMRTRYSDISVGGGVPLHYGQRQDLGNGVRSEERRVGTEGRSGRTRGRATSRD